jgi:hypothetical protein
MGNQNPVLIVSSMKRMVIPVPLETGIRDLEDCILGFSILVHESNAQSFRILTRIVDSNELIHERMWGEVCMKKEL